MLMLLYFTLFLALAGAALRWQAARYEREHALIARRPSRGGRRR
jgi:hypothetical protein